MSKYKKLEVKAMLHAANFCAESRLSTARDLLEEIVSVAARKGLQ